MKIIKRSGTEVGFDISKIIAAVSKANKEAVENEQLSDNDINEISDKVQNICSSVNRTLSVEEIQDLVENEIMNKWQENISPIDIKEVLYVSLIQLMIRYLVLSNAIMKKSNRKTQIRIL